NPISIHLRHHDVAENQVRLFAPRNFHALASIFSLNRLVLMKPEQRRDVPSHFRFVFDHQDFFHRPFPNTGTLTVTVVPAPSSLTNLTFPWCRSMKRFTMSS